MLILFLGRNTENILSEARQKLDRLDEKALIVTRDNDRMEVPKELQTINVSSFQPTDGISYTVIGNGGTTSQLVPVIRKLVEASADFKIFDLQRDGVSQLW